MDQVCSNLQSTKNNTVPQKDFLLINYPSHPKSFETFSQFIVFSPEEFSNGNLTGAFLSKSSRDNKYLYLLYDNDSNTILVAVLQQTITVGSNSTSATTLKWTKQPT